MKIWAALLVIPVLLLATGCEQHSVSDLQKISAAPPADTTTPAVSAN